MKVIVVGGGASGLVSAIVAARRGNDVTILERNRVCGKKLLVTGNGRCNYYNDDQRIKHYHSSSLLDINEVINENNLKRVCDFFKSIGVVSKVRDGYYYPYSNQAVSVVNSLINECLRLGIKIVNNFFVTDICKKNGRFVVSDGNYEYDSDKIIISSGSYAYYKNMDINSYDLVNNFGHDIVEVIPALVQLKVNDGICKKWAGVRSSVLIKLYEDNKYIREEYGEVTLTNYGISGICAMQLSGMIARGINNGKGEEVCINFVYDLASNIDEFRSYLDNYFKDIENISVIEILDNLVNYKLGNAIMDRCGFKGNILYNELNDKDKNKLCLNLVEFRINIDGVNGFGEAQVCSGGVNMKDVNINTMESKIVDGLYMVGELLDIDGDCGGYNLTWAWISGIIAGSSI